MLCDDSGKAPLIESGISVHTLTLKGFVSLDMYACGVLDVDDTACSLSERLGASRFDVQHLTRGSNYHDLAADTAKLPPGSDEESSRT